ncbi:hypothetical protein SAMN04515617_1257 [Collimonas sp. OK242]|jgi:hypothetical protein|uniref:hypothetical protein n=1 Tax=Collimonas sp. OK242 TaxID=1798195 RepID=UPI0008944FA8|nr:hypothetical protein [Collimonas sp. OK242]SDY85153.1 hypothetical protein SAMN04515617_1257 [Collimonas sp. OK242]
MAPAILDQCWVASVERITEIDQRLSQFCPWDDELKIFIAGKSTAPDSDSYSMAATVTKNLGSQLSMLADAFPKIGFDGSDWNMTTIWFPYQSFRKCWYVTFTSEYGSDIDFAFVSDSKQPDNCDIQIVGQKRGSFVDAPGFVKYTINCFRRASISNQDFFSVLRRIENEKIFGTEIVGPLLTILETSMKELRDPEYCHLKELLQSFDLTMP